MNATQTNSRQLKMHTRRDKEPGLLTKASKPCRTGAAFGKVATAVLFTASAFFFDALSAAF